MEEYPERLLPPEGATKRGDNEPFADKNTQVIARWHDAENLGSIYKGNGHIDSSLVDYKQFPRLSCNYCPPSEYTDLQIVILDKQIAYQEWIEGDEVVVPQSEDFEIVESKEVYALPFAKIIGERLPYKIDGQTHHLTIQIAHNPLVANFPHCEFKLMAGHTGSEIHKLSSTSPSYHQMLITSIRRMLENYAYKCI